MTIISRKNSDQEQARSAVSRRFGGIGAIVVILFISVVVQILLTKDVVDFLIYPLFTLLLIGLLRLLPPRLTVTSLLVEVPISQICNQARNLLGYAVLFPFLLIPVVIWGRVQNLALFPHLSASWALSWNYIVVGKIGLLFLPTVYFVWCYGGDGWRLGLRGLDTRWRWIGPIVALVANLGLLALQVGGVSIAKFPVWPVVVVVVLIFFAAGFAEEFFYRVLLQTRLEVLLGRWNGIAVTSVLFALLHLPSRFVFIWLGMTGHIPLDLVGALTAVLALQGVLGFFYGYLWSRYHNAWFNCLIHLLFDSVPLVLLLVGAVSKVN